MGDGEVISRNLFYICFYRSLRSHKQVGFLFSSLSCSYRLDGIEKKYYLSFV